MSRVVMVTGASRGIGLEVACALARRGYSLVLVARREPELEFAVAECQLMGASFALVCVADVSDDDQVLRAFETAEREVGPVEIVVHNVPAYGEFAHLPPEVLDRVRQINVAPLAESAKAVRAILQVIDGPPPARSVADLYPLMHAAVMFTPGLYDLIVAPFLKRMALADRQAPPHTANLFDSLK